MRLLCKLTFYCCFSAGVLALNSVHAVAKNRLYTLQATNSDSIIVDNSVYAQKSNFFVIAQSTSRFSCVEEARELYYRKTSANSDEAVALAEEACSRSLSPSCLEEAHQYYYRRTSANSDQAMRRAEEFCAREAGSGSSDNSNFVVIVNDTNRTIRYNMDGQDYSLNPNNQLIHRNGGFNISFDSSFINGDQEVSYQLNSGTTNRFQATGNAIDLIYDK